MAAAADKATARESEVAIAEATRHKAAAAAVAITDAKKAKHKAEVAAELKERDDLGLGTPGFRKRLLSEMTDSEGGFSGLDAKTGEDLKFNESVRQLRSMRVKVAASTKEKQKRASQKVPLNAPVYTEGTNIFLGRAAQAPTTTLLLAPLAGAVECVEAFV